MAKFVAHMVVNDRLYCADDKIRPVEASHRDRVAQCPVCFGQGPRRQERSWVEKTEPVSDYIDRLFKGK